jgi:hypothetical protein
MAKAMKAKAKETNQASSSNKPMKVIKEKTIIKMNDKESTKAKTPPKAKASPKGKVSAKRLLALANLGGPAMTIDEKIAALRKSVQSEGVDAAIAGAAVLSKLDRSKIWQKAQTAMKGDPQLKADYESASQAGKAAQTRLLLAWRLDPAKGEIYHSCKQSMVDQKDMTKTLKWISHKEALDKWGEEELNLHLASGKVSWREDPITPGIYEYRNNHDYM